MDGFPIIECMRSDPTLQHVPIVVISAQDELDCQGALGGAVLIAKGGGLMPGEVVKSIQKVAQAMSRTWTLKCE